MLDRAVVRGHGRRYSEETSPPYFSRGVVLQSAAFDMEQYVVTSLVVLLHN